MEEIELTFLPKSLPDRLFQAEHQDIFDIYLPASAAHPVLRIRKAGNKYEITKKAPPSEQTASIQREITVSLTADEFDELERFLPGKRLLKTRYYHIENGIKYEVGIFQGPFKGLVLVDIEFGTLDQMKAYRPAKWLLADVTEEEFVAGGMLCGKKYSDIEKNLDAFGYKKM